MSVSAPELLTESHDVSHFSCGKPALDHWLKARALSNQQRGFTVVMVVHDARRVVGFHGLAPTAVTASSLPRSIRTGQPPEPVPCLLLAQLATDVGWAGQGVGSGLLKHALIRCVEAAKLVGGRALLVRAIPPRGASSPIDEDAADFWNRRGFLPTKDDPFMLYRSMADITASVRAAAASS